MADYNKTIQFQFNDSPIIQLMDNMYQYFDETVNLTNFYNYVWNVYTAEGFGLDTWGNIVNISRYLPVSNTEYFGYSNQSGINTGWFGFNQAPFNDGSFNTGQTPIKLIKLTDQAFRQLILAKALLNISPTTIPAINQILMNLFPNRGSAYVEDLGNMQMRYYFDFELTPFELTIVNSGLALPRPTGVQVFIVTL